MTDLNAGLAKIWEKRRSLIQERLSWVEKASTAFALGSCSAELRVAAAENAHVLAGALGAFGLVEASNIAREAETALRKSVMSAAEAGRLLELAHTLRSLVERGPELQ